MLDAGVLVSWLVLTMLGQLRPQITPGTVRHWSQVRRPRGHDPSQWSTDSNNGGHLGSFVWFFYLVMWKIKIRWSPYKDQGNHKAESRNNSDNESFCLEIINIQITADPDSWLPTPKTRVKCIQMMMMNLTAGCRRLGKKCFISLPIYRWQSCGWECQLEQDNLVLGLTLACNYCHKTAPIKPGLSHHLSCGNNGRTNGTNLQLSTDWWLQSTFKDPSNFNNKVDWSN